MRWILAILAMILSAVLIVLAVLAIYYWPVIDRIYIRPCHYYPKTFIDCKER